MPKNTFILAAVAALLLLPAAGMSIRNQDCKRKTFNPGDAIRGCTAGCGGFCYRRTSGTVYFGRCEFTPNCDCNPKMTPITINGEYTDCLPAAGPCGCNLTAWLPFSGGTTVNDC